MANKRLWAAVPMLVAAVGSWAQESADSVGVNMLGEAQVVASRAYQTTPIAHTDIGKAELKYQNFGQDIPFLLSLTPGVVATSDAGNGIGYTSLRVRGCDPSGINVTNNGIPLNDAESHILYWVDIPDFASSVENIQIQRGAGASVTGVASFGSNISMRTEDFSRVPYFELNGSYGSYNSQKETLKFGTGLLYGHWAFDGRLSHIASDGYRDRASTDMGSYYAQLAYSADKTLLRLITFGAKETTYHAWDGISKQKLKTDRRYNPNGKIQDDEGNVIGFYKDQNDVFIQNHYQLLLTQILSPRWTLSAVAHYTYGKGWYEEYKNQRTLTDYGLQPFELNGQEVECSDLVRRKYNRGNFGGGMLALHYKTPVLSAHLGGAFNYFDNDHYGEVRWVKQYLNPILPNQLYYMNRGRKGDANFYARGEWTVLPRLVLYGDLQFRHLHYVITGTNDDAYNRMDIHETFDFFNPKLGAMWNVHRGGELYASFGIVHKEPSRNNYTDGFLPGMRLPKPECLMDLEMGYRIKGKRWEAGANIYYMHYDDELVLTGRVNHIGEPIVENVDRSYRMGVELTGAWRVCKWLKWDANLSFSRNRIKDYTAYLYNYYGDWQMTDPIHIGETTTSFSPSFVGNNVFTFMWKGLSAAVQSQYVSRQYLDNLGQKESLLNPYFLTHLNVNYSIPVRGMKELLVGVTVYNVFNNHYETNGYSQTSYSENGGQVTLHQDPRYYPMAGANVLLHTTIRF